MTYRDRDLATELEVCDATRTVRCGGREVKLADLSFRLLRSLGERAPEPVSFAEIEQRVWGARVSRETVKQRAKMLRDGLAAVGMRDGIQAVRSVGYRLTTSLGAYEKVRPSAPFWEAGRVQFAIAVAVMCAVVLLLVLPHFGGAAAARPLTISIRSEAAVDASTSAEALDGARRLLVRDLSRLSGLTVVHDAVDGPTDLVVGMRGIALPGGEALALELVEADTGLVLWAETYPLKDGAWDRAVSHFVSAIHAQLEVLVLPRSESGFSGRPTKAKELYLAASELARNGDEASLRAARERLRSILETWPQFALARALRVRIDSQLVVRHGVDRSVAHAALTEAQSLVAAHPEMPEYRRALAAAQIATGDLDGALQNLRTAQRRLPFLRRDILALERQIGLRAPSNNRRMTAHRTCDRSPQLDVKTDLWVDTKGSGNTFGPWAGRESLPVDAIHRIGRSIPPRL